MARQRLTPTQRKAQIVDAAVRIAERDGLEAITRDGVAAEAKCATGLVSHYFRPLELLVVEVKGKMHG